MINKERCSVQNYKGVKNQFLICTQDFDTKDTKTIFQSYNSIIAVIEHTKNGFKTTLGKDWDYSKTTGKYRNLFLNETKKETESKIKTGTYTIDETL